MLQLHYAMFPVTKAVFTTAAGVLYQEKNLPP
jgi:hypothetical protein